MRQGIAAKGVSTSYLIMGVLSIAQMLISFLKFGYIFVKLIMARWKKLDVVHFVFDKY